jgi:ArsR family transcriptional regulator, arsenate/arsenite/antimonite-responsive transcriptional repressor / arsenate reductase (thioredoxin)
MSTERTVKDRAQALAALADPARLFVVDTLALSDRSPGDLASDLDISGNLLAHHLNVLQEAGIIRRLRSEADRRRSYVQLVPGSLDGLLRVAPHPAVPRVVFVCTQNSARSQMASALWSSRSEVPVASAGTHPASRINPGAVAVARRHGVRIRRARPTHVSDVLDSGDYIISVCDSAHEELKSSDVRHVHWSVPDPVPAGTDTAFERAFTDVERRVRHLADLIHSNTDKDLA